MDKLIFANPNAGNALANKLTANDYQIITDLSQYDQAINAIIEDTHIITAGGDGTAHLIVNKLFQAKKLDLIKLSVLPMGTGNDLARCMGFLNTTLDDYKTTEQKRLHLWKMTKATADNTQQEVFINFIGIGIDAQVVSTAEKMRSFHNRIYTQAMYVVAAARHLFYRLPKATKIECDNETIKCTGGVVLANTHSYAGGCQLSDGKQNFDKCLNVFKLHSCFDLIRFILTRLFKRIVIKPNLTASHATITGKNLYVEMDGEVLKGSKEEATITVEAAEAKLTFLVPTRP